MDTVNYYIFSRLISDILLIALLVIPIAVFYYIQKVKKQKEQEAKENKEYQKWINRNQ